MFPIEEPPQSVVQSVRPHLHNHEKVPLFLFHEVFRNSEAFLGHIINLSQYLVIVIRSEILDIQHIPLGYTFYLGFEFGWICVLAVGTRSQEGSDHTAIDTSRWVSLRDTYEDRSSPCLGEDVPYGIFLDHG